MIVIVNTGISNRYSINNAFNFIGCEVIVSSKPEDIKNAKKLVFPGVGAFARGMQALADLDLITLLNDQVLNIKKPILGICLGYQMMAESSREGGKCKGLGWIPGEVEAISSNDPNLKIPHIGFNTVRSCGQPKLLDAAATEADYYFVHGYHLKTDLNIVTGTVEYGSKLVAAIEYENIFGVQFHPEKSQSSGLALLKRFSEIS